jgi:hypothetical protein
MDEIIQFRNTQWEFRWLLGKSSLARQTKMCTEMNRNYIFESSPSRLLSRYDAEPVVTSTGQLQGVEALIRSSGSEHVVQSLP